MSKKKHCCSFVDDLINNFYYCLCCCCPGFGYSFFSTISSCCSASYTVPKFKEDKRWNKVTLKEALEMSSNGDMIFCGSNYGFSKFVEKVSESNISHVIYIFEKNGEKFTVESSADKYVFGIGINKVKERFDQVQKLWDWCFLLKVDTEVREKINNHQKEIYELIMKSKKRSVYDISAGMRICCSDFCGPAKYIVQHNHYEDFMCSELIGNILQVSGVLPYMGKNVSVLTPQELLEIRIFQDKYYQFYGHNEEKVYLKNFNSQALGSKFDLSEIIIEPKNDILSLFINVVKEKNL